MSHSEHDVVVVGAGIAGAIMADRLASAGLRVLVLEAGPNLKSRQFHIQQWYQAAAKGPPSSPWRHNHREARSPTVLDIVRDDWRNGEQYYLHQTGDLPFSSTYDRLAGGTANHWQGITPRMLPNDFKLRTMYGRARDWPINYDKIEPYYTDAEYYIGVSGNHKEWQGVGNAHRSEPFPMPAIPLSYLDQVLRRRLKRVPIAVDIEPGSRAEELRIQRVPQARNSIGRDGRPPCMGNTNCIPICPIDAKYTPSLHLYRAQHSSDTPADIVCKAVAYRIDVDDTGRVTGICYRSWEDGEDHVAHGRHYVLAANPIETAKLLLMSPWRTIERTEVAVANRSDQVGRNLMDHVIHLSWGLVDEPVYSFRGPLRTGTIDEFRDGKERADRSAWVIAIANTGWGWPTGAPFSTVQDHVKAGLYGRDLRESVANHLSRQISFTCEFEQLPAPENRIRPSCVHKDDLNIPRPEISYGLSDYEKRGFLAANGAMKQIFRAIGEEKTNNQLGKPNSFRAGGKVFQLRGAGHIMGTTRMGSPKQANETVVDTGLRCHDHENLSIVGGAVFPTVGTSNPTLTIAALALRLAERLACELGVELPAIPRDQPIRGQRAAAGGTEREDLPLDSDAPIASAS